MYADMRRLHVQVTLCLCTPAPLSPDATVHPWPHMLTSIPPLS